jgi:sugar lactone lactonase YvrE
MIAPKIYTILTCCLTVATSIASPKLARAAEREVLASGLVNPESVAVADDGRIFVSIIGKNGTAGDGLIALIENGAAKTFATGLDDPKGITYSAGNLYAADNKRVWKIDASGAATVFAAEGDFPIKPRMLNDVAAGPNGDLFVSDSGTFFSEGAIFRITPKKEITVVVHQKQAPMLKAPNGLLVEGADTLLLADYTASRLYRVGIADGKVTEVAANVVGADGIARDDKGRIFVGDWKSGRVYLIDTAAGKPTVFADGFKAAADITFAAKPARLLVPDMRAGTVTAIRLDE